jgi:hypothetical protein
MRNGGYGKPALAFTAGPRPALLVKTPRAYLRRRGVSLAGVSAGLIRDYVWDSAESRRSDMDSMRRPVSAAIAVMWFRRAGKVHGGRRERNEECARTFKVRHRRPS